MPLEILGPLVVVGIALVVVIVHYSGISRTSGLDHEKQVLRVFNADYPGHNVVECVISTDRSSAFLLSGGKEIGLVESMGDKFITRLLEVGDIKRVERIGERGVNIRFADFTLSEVKFINDEPQIIQNITTHLDALRLA